MKKYLLLILLFFGFQLGHAKILPITDLEPLEAEILERGCLVLFDVDSTLIAPEDAILHPTASPLLDSLLGCYKVQDLPTGRRYLFREILLQAPHRLVEDRSVQIIQTLQERGIPVIAFTAAPRGKIGKIESVADWRIKELSRFGFDFSSAFPNVGSVELPKDPSQEFSPLFKRGILFASLHPKGATLKKFLLAIGHQPKQLILIDDQMECIESVEQAAKELGIPFIGFHYTAAEKLPCHLDPDLAAFQIATFLEEGNWKSDSEARASCP